MAKRRPYVFASGVEAGRRALVRLCEADLLPSLILTYDSSLSDRSGFSSLLDIAKRQNIPALATSDINAEAVLDAVDNAQPVDLLVVAGWSQIVKQPLLARFSRGGVGLHPSLLPEGRGRAPIPWTLIKGYEKSGVTLFRLEEEVDSGEVIGVAPFDISRRDDAGKVYEIVSEAQAHLLVKNVPRLLAGASVGRRQGGGGSAWPRRRPEDGLIVWSIPGDQIYDFVRGLTRPYPGAFTTLPDTRSLRVWSADLVEVPVTIAASPGTVLGAVFSTATGGVAVASGDSTVVILREVEVEGEEPSDGLSLVESGLLKRGNRLG